MELYNNKEESERAVLIAVDSGEYDCDASLDELEKLAETASVQTIGRASQKRDAPNPATFFGPGKIKELAEFCKNGEADLIIADDELSPTQIRNIEKAADVRTIDRTTLILDIFASRSVSREGKLQVELARLKYFLPRLTGRGTSLSRLGGGVGTRGPGETKLEADRRYLRRRIKRLEREFESLKKRRDFLRERRKKDGVETVALAGYTNAGKSTLMNALTDAGVLVEDKLFATLDPASRALKLPDGRKVTLVDSVGFIRRLPHNLIEAFKSTLEEAARAEAILCVCDASDPECGEHMEVTRKLLDELGCSQKPIITVFNKRDRPGAEENLSLDPRGIAISALNGEGLDALLWALAKALPPKRARVKTLIPYSDGAAAAELRADGVVYEEKYEVDGLYLDILTDARLIDKYKKYCI